ncbi:MAG: RDD family protein [Myxococcota bacterium]|nr:RDD family protein [Myxococcota bacterium]
MEDVTVLEPVGCTRRLVAAGIDAIPVVTLWVLSSLGWTTVTGMEIPQSRWNALDQAIELSLVRPELVGVALLSLGTIIVLWHVLGERLLGGSLGKRILGIQVIDQRGEGLGLLRSLVYGVLRLVSAASLGAGFLWALIDAEGRTFHDRLTGTFVVINVTSQRTS